MAFAFFGPNEGKQTVSEVYVIGDAARLGEILDAMMAANEVARKI